MDAGLRLLWYVFSAAWIVYLVLVMAVAGRQKRIWEQIRGVREQLAKIASR
jgi:hypothetical protein